MLQEIKELFNSKELLEGWFGLEREMLRVDSFGNLSFKSHPEVFGDKAKNPYITTDFSESQIEVITPTLGSVEEVYNFTRALYDIVTPEIGDELLWPQSMPCIIPEGGKIPVADYGEAGKAAKEYREMLLEKYGARKQLISGIHFNFSFKDEFIQKLYDNSNQEISFKEYKNNIYLKLTRNYLRYRWLIIYLFGAAAVVDVSYTTECSNKFKHISKRGRTNSSVISYRNGNCGYKNNVDLFPSYNSVDEYIESLNNYISDKLITSHKELYSQVRLKPKNPNNFIESLKEDGIQYLEYRTFDVNPFEKGGISLVDLKFMQLFNIYLLVKEESDYPKWQEEALENQHIIARYGKINASLKRYGTEVLKTDFALDLLKDMKEVCVYLDLENEEVIQTMIDRVTHVENTYAYKITQKVKDEGFINAFTNLANEYKQSANNNRFKLTGYENLELSTQILIREAIKRGIKFSILDGVENFISLSKDNKTEYIKQATKTSKDNYVNVLMMENKVITKKVLQKSSINTPKGDEFNSIEEAKEAVYKFENMPVVVKPKSTNFGIGINIFPNGATRLELEKAIEYAFEHDNSIIIEEFFEGKEFRFLVIGDKVLGVLNRVPANVKGDGINSIEKLVSIKNENSLRGKGYKTPLEKIIIDENVKLFLNNKNLDIAYVPKEGEIVYLRENSNISTGGDSIDYTDVMPQRFKNIAIEATKSIGATICGVDMAIKDYKLSDSDYTIIELNFNPAIHIHSFPYMGEERNIAISILELLELV